MICVAVSGAAPGFFREFPHAEAVQEAVQRAARFLIHELLISAVAVKRIGRPEHRRNETLHIRDLRAADLEGFALCKREAEPVARDLRKFI